MGRWLSGWVVGLGCRVCNGQFGNPTPAPGYVRLVKLGAIMEYSYSFGNAISYDSSKIPPRSKEDEPNVSLFDLFKDFDHSTKGTAKRSQ